MKSFSFSYKRTDGTEKTPEELGDEIADALEAEGIDPSTIRVTGVSEDFGVNPHIVRIPLKCTWVKVSS